MKNEEQIKFWNHEGGDFWAKEADGLDLLLEPIGLAILDAAHIKPTDHVLDIGCGPGALTIAAAKKARSALGVDLSSRLITLAKERAKVHGVKADFVQGDAAVYRPPNQANIILSRVGVMFFDQAVEAFAKIRKDAAPKAKLVFASWAAIDKNPWIVEVLEVLKPVLEQEAPSQTPHVPGPFSLSDPRHVQSLLEEAGWKNVSISLWKDTLGMPAKSPEEAAIFFSKINPAARRAAKQGVAEEKLISILSKYFEEKLEREGQILAQGAALLVSASAS